MEIPVPRVESAMLKLASGWTAVVALNDSTGRPLGLSAWKTCLADPDSLLMDPHRSLRSDGSNHVILKTIRPGPEEIRVVIKHHTKAPGLKGIFRSLQSSRALRNFRTAEKLCSSSLPTAWPLAAIQRKIGPATIESFYITEFVENSQDLYHFLKDRVELQKSLDINQKRRLCDHVCQIFAGLHKLGLWHHDAKAGNFLVRKNESGGHGVILVDMDGIKPYTFLSGDQRFKSMAKLASVLIWSSELTTGDYLRIFSNYARLTNLDKKRQRSVFKSIERQAHAVRLLTMARTVTNIESSPDGKV